MIPLPRTCSVANGPNGVASGVDGVTATPLTLRGIEAFGLRKPAW